MYHDRTNPLDDPLKNLIFNPHDDQKFSYLENLTLETLVKIVLLLTRYGYYISTRNGHFVM